MIIPNSFLQSAGQYGYNLGLMQNSGVSHLYVDSNKILSSQKVPGLFMTAKSFSQGVKAKIIVKKGVKIQKPIFLCFGMEKKRGKQIIVPEIILEENSEATILAHCTFPQATRTLHKMLAKVELKKGAKLIYTETQYHGEKFGTNVVSDFKFLLRDNSYLENKFLLKQGTIGKMKINLDAELGKNAFIDVNTQIIGKGDKDDVLIFDKVLLKGSNSRGLIKLKGVVVNGGKMIFNGEANAGPQAKNARGHVDCQEIIVGKKSIARSVPIISVSNPDARITHEASVGKVSQKELETLMTRGLTESQAIDFIIRGKLTQEINLNLK